MSAADRARTLAWIDGGCGLRHTHAPMAAENLELRAGPLPGGILVKLERVRVDKEAGWT
jgi:hypothetical protein